MKSTIRNIGNSRGIIIPQSILKECHIENEVNIEIHNNNIVISPAVELKRKGWEDAFKQMAKNGDDHLVIPDVFDDENIEDWKW
ncbi:MAG: peptidase [Mucilaginibacter sp.]|nr:peptidase [Mucilaginibacter sp.]